MNIRYKVGIDDPNEHTARMTVEVSGVSTPRVDFVLPSWVPGSYHIVDYARNVREFAASLPGGGASLAVSRIDKARWSVESGGAASIEVRYSVYGHDLITEAVDVTPEHLFLNAALALPYIDGRKDEPVELELHLPADWRIVTELSQVGTHPPRFRAENYDELVDQPVDCGNPTVLSITPMGIPHRIVLCGQGGNYEPHRLEEDITKIVEATIRMFGDSPVRSYTFFYHLTDAPDGGLEHRSSNSSVVPRNCFKPQEDYLRFLRLTSHEYFHLYNVKRIRPKVLGPFDYTKENYTKLLWVMEGTTNYFGDLILRRAGLYSPSKYLETTAKIIARVLDTPGRRLTSLEAASYITWVDLYQPSEESVNQSVSYYLKGHLVSMCLDLEIRHLTENRSSLETVFRHLWTEYGKPERGLEEDELLPILFRTTGLDLAPFFSRYVSGTDEIDFDAFAQRAGLTLKPKPKDPEDDGEPGYLGIRYETRGAIVRVTTVLTETPGRRAGITPGDEIVAFNGAKVAADDFSKALKRYPPGTPVDVALFRRGWLMHLSVTMGKAPPEKYLFTPIENPTALQQAVYEQWLGAKWEPAKKSEKSAS